MAARRVRSNNSPDKNFLANDSTLTGSPVRSELTQSNLINFEKLQSEGRHQIRQPSYETGKKNLEVIQEKES